jgi:hypothetical protein
MEETNNFQPAETQIETPAPLNPFQRFIGIFTSPMNTLKDVAARPDWIVPMAILVLTSIILVYLLLPAILADASRGIEKMVDAGKIPMDQAEKMQEASETFTGKIAPLLGGLKVIVFSLVTTALLLFVGNIILSGKATFQQMFSVYLWTGMVDLLGSILRLPLALKQNTMMVFFSPAAFFPEEAQESVLFKVSSFLDVFALWRIALIGLGFAVLYRFSVGKSLGTVFGMYALLIAVSVAFMGLF